MCVFRKVIIRKVNITLSIEVPCFKEKPKIQIADSRESLKDAGREGLESSAHRQSDSPPGIQ